MRHPTSRTALLAFAALLTLAACSRSPSSSTGTLSATASEQEAAEQDPCSLLLPKEVEAALGAPLATPPFRLAGGTPGEGGQQCAYEDAHFHRIVVEVDWEGATAGWKLMGNLQSMINQGPTKGMLHLVDGTEIAGTWDEARVEGCCSFATLLGDQGVTIDAGSSNVSVAAAAKLADAALQRLEKPAAINGDAGVSAAQAYEAAHRPKHRSACELITRAEAEAILGPLIADPKAQGDSCDYEVPPQGIRQVYELSIQWTGGYSRFHEDNQMLAGFAKGITAGISGEGKTDIEKLLAGTDSAPAGPQPWELVHENITGIAAVKNDVLMSIDTRGVNARNSVKLLQTAMSRL